MELLKIITALKARQNLGELLEEVFYKQGHFLIKRGAKPMAVVIPLEEYESYRKQRDSDFKVFDEIREQNKRFSATEIERDVQEAVNAVRRQKCSK